MEHNASKYIPINILELIDIYGENCVLQSLSNFICPQNIHVEEFIQKNSIEFAKKRQSITYVVVDPTVEYYLGFFTIAIKSITIPADSISKTLLKRVARIGNYNKVSNSFTTSAFLLAQIGKNKKVSTDLQISGDVLLDLAMNEISKISRLAGGVLQFLECEDIPYLMKFYEKHNFVKFNYRFDEEYMLHQYIRKID